MLRGWGGGGVVTGGRVMGWGAVGVWLTENVLNQISG